MVEQPSFQHVGLTSSHLAGEHLRDVAARTEATDPVYKHKDAAGVVSSHRRSDGGLLLLILLDTFPAQFPLHQSQKSAVSRRTQDLLHPSTATQEGPPKYARSTQRVTDMHSLAGTGVG